MDPDIFQRIVTCSADGVLIVDWQGIVCFVNPAATTLLGCPADDLIGHPFGFPVKRGQTFELDIPRADGGKALLEARVTTLEWENEPAQLISLRDITERKQLEKTLREFMSPEAFDDIRSRTERRRATGYRDTYETEIIWPNGERRIILATVTPWQDAAGLFAGTSAVFRDVTESKRLYETLQQELAQHQRVEAELRAQKQLFEKLVAVARVTAERPSLQETLRAALNVAIALTDASDGDILLLDKSGAVTDWILPREITEAEDQSGLILAIMNKGLAGWVARHREPALLADTGADDRWLALPNDLYRAGSALSVPIVSGPVLTGVLTLAHRNSNHFAESDLRFVQAAADQMALALQNAQMFEEQRRMAHRQVTLYEALRAVSRQLDPTAIPRAAVETVVQFTHWPHTSIATLDSDNLHWQVAAASGYLSAAEGITRTMQQGIVGRAFRTGQTQLVPDVDADPDYVPGHLAIRCELAVPIRREDRLLGVLNIESDRLDTFNADDVLMAESLAEAIALAMENARLYDQERRHAADLSALYTIMLTTGQTLALEEVLERALSSALATLEFDAGAVDLAEPGYETLRMAAMRGLPLPLLQQLRSEGLVHALCLCAHRRRESVVFNYPGDAPPEAARLVEKMGAAGWSTFAAFPLLRGEQSLGAINLFARRPHPILSSDVALFTTIGQQIATAVAHAQLFQATQEERGRLQALITASRDGVVLIGTDGRILVINAQALAALHLPDRPENWLGRRLRELPSVLWSQSRVGVRTLLAEMRRIQSGHEPPSEGEFDLPLGIVHWQNLPVLSGDASIGRLVVLRDVTHERAVERLRDDMVKTMVHDLRNPLSAAFTAIDYLQGDSIALAPDQVEALQVASHSVNRVLRLVSSILEINQLEAGRMPLNRTAIAVHDLVSETLRVQSTLAAAKQLRLENRVPHDLPPAWADAGLIGRVLQNLVDNAIKFTPPGGLVSVTAWRREGAERPAIHISVSDTGPGIPPAIQSQLFQKFVTGQQKGHGSGLGLAFCKLALEAHGERLWVESGHASGKTGTTFIFTLSAAQASDIFVLDHLLA